MSTITTTLPVRPFRPYVGHEEAMVLAEVREQEEHVVTTHEHHVAQGTETLSGHTTGYRLS